MEEKPIKDLDKLELIFVVGGPIYNPKVNEKENLCVRNNFELDSLSQEQIKLFETGADFVELRLPLEEDHEKEIRIYKKVLDVACVKGVCNTSHPWVGGVMGPSAEYVPLRILNYELQKDLKSIPYTPLKEKLTGKLGVPSRYEKIVRKEDIDLGS